MAGFARMSVGVSVSVRDREGRLLKKIFDPIIYKGDRLPFTRDRIYKTTKDLQRAVSVKVYGGENPIVEDNLELGNFLIENIPKNDAGKEKVDISFHMNKEMLLYIFITIQSTGVEDMRTIDTRLVQRELKAFNSIYRDKL
ncbi:MAG: Hsp70 family protein [Tissierella sp.]|uniref:Hsp70 family protein n=1 Tax=Tissierella sp. TaxID=41274 RepID=UPI003F9E3F28